MNPHEVRRNLAKAVDRWENEGGTTRAEDSRCEQPSATHFMSFGRAELRPVEPHFVTGQFERKENAR